MEYVDTLFTSPDHEFSMVLYTSMITIFHYKEDSVNDELLTGSPHELRNMIKQIVDCNEIPYDICAGMLGAIVELMKEPADVDLDAGDADLSCLDQEEFDMEFNF